VASTRADRVHHWILLWLAVAVVVLAMAFRLDTTGSVAIPGMQQSMPTICSFRRLTGLPCPGCGLTRCFVALAHGNWGAAWRYNPAGFLVFALVLGQIPYRIMQLWRLYRGQPEFRSRFLSYWMLWALIFALVGQWIVKLTLGVPAQ
jgi:hypothetical protein